MLTAESRETVCVRLWPDSRTPKAAARTTRPTIARCRSRPDRAQLRAVEDPRRSFDYLRAATSFRRAGSLPHSRSRRGQLLVVLPAGRTRSPSRGRRYLHRPARRLARGRHYPVRFPLVEAEFDQLPFARRQFDLAILQLRRFTTRPTTQDTLAEARRCLQPGRPRGRSRFARLPRREHGDRMAAERHAVLRAATVSAPTPSAASNFSTARRLDSSRATSACDGTVHRPWYGWRWHLRPLEGADAAAPAAFAFLDSGRRVRAMIILLHPRSTRPKNRRFPLSVLVARRGARRQGGLRHRRRQRGSRIRRRRSTASRASTASSCWPSR